MISIAYGFHFNFFIFYFFIHWASLSLKLICSLHLVFLVQILERQFLPVLLLTFFWSKDSSSILMKVVSLCFNGYWNSWIGWSSELTLIGMPQTVCRTSGSDVMSFHFLKYDLIETALNCFTFSSRNYFKRSKSHIFNKLSKFNVWFGNCSR